MNILQQLLGLGNGDTRRKGLERQSTPGLQIMQHGGQGLNRPNLSGSGLSLQAMPGLNGYGGGMQMRRPQGIPLGGRGMTEDNGLSYGPQGPVPMNMDIAHFRGGGMPQGGQFNPGYNPLQNHNIVPYQLSPQPTSQNVQNWRHQNPQLSDDGYFYY